MFSSPIDTKNPKTKKQLRNNRKASRASVHFLQKTKVKKAAFLISGFKSTKYQNYHQNNYTRPKQKAGIFNQLICNYSRNLEAWGWFLSLEDLASGGGGGAVKKERKERKLKGFGESTTEEASKFIPPLKFKEFLDIF